MDGNPKHDDNDDNDEDDNNNRGMDGQTDRRMKINERTAREGGKLQQEE